MKYAENRHLSLVLEILLLEFVEYIHLCSNLFDKKKINAVYDITKSFKE